MAVNEVIIDVVSSWAITESELKEKELNEYRENLEELVKFRTAELERTNEQLMREILQKEATEKELYRANQEMISTIENISDGFITVNHQWIITYANKALLKVLEADGLQVNFIGSDFFEAYKHGDRAIINDCCRRVMRDRHPMRVESFATIFRRWIELSICPTDNGISIFFRNIDKRKNNEKAVEEEHQRMYSVCNAIPGLIFVQEDNYKIRFANQNFQTIFGSCEGKTCYEVISGLTTPCSDCVLLDVIKGSKSCWKDVVINNRIYEVFAQPYTDVDGSNLIFKVLIDITDRKNSERDFMRMESLKMVGEMAAGIAHEVRNPLTTVRGFLQLLAAKDSTRQYHDFYELMIEELDRANCIISDFLSLAGNKSTGFEQIDLSGFVKDLYPLLSADALNQDKEIRLELEQVPGIHGNKSELRQLLLNLARNGLEAMQVGTTLTIQTARLDKHILLRVCDQGGGIDPLILKRLGTPFLTTKDKGTGLGLAICYSIVVHHNAEMFFESNPTGTTVTVKFGMLETVQYGQEKNLH